MSVTALTRALWHSVTDAIWADSAAAGDVESVPADGEIIAGHLNNTGLTSGRANYLHAFLAELGQKFRDVVYPQHTDAGAHFEVQCTGDQNDVKLDVQYHNLDTDPVVGFQITHNLSLWLTHQFDGHLRNYEGCYLREGTIHLGANDFRPVRESTDYPNLTSDALGSYIIDSPNDSVDYYAISRSLNELQYGTRITLLTMTGNRPTAGGQVMTLELLSRTPDQVGATTEASFVLGAGTGEISTGSGALTETLVSSRLYYLRVTMNNNTPGGGNTLQFRGVMVTFDCP